jgi:hypothetical protein
MSAMGRVEPHSNLESLVRSRGGQLHRALPILFAWVDCGPRPRDLRPLLPLPQSLETERQDGEIDQRGVSGEFDLETGNNSCLPT